MSLTGLTLDACVTRRIENRVVNSIIAFTTSVYTML